MDELIHKAEEMKATHFFMVSGTFVTDARLNIFKVSFKSIQLKVLKTLYPWNLPGGLRAALIYER